MVPVQDYLSADDRIVYFKRSAACASANSRVLLLRSHSVILPRSRFSINRLSASQRDEMNGFLLWLDYRLFFLAGNQQFFFLQRVWTAVTSGCYNVMGTMNTSEIGLDNLIRDLYLIFCYINTYRAYYMAVSQSEFSAFQHELFPSLLFESSCLKVFVHPRRTLTKKLRYTYLDRPLRCSLEQL